MTVVAARAVYRGYVQDGKRAGQVRRLHIVREVGPAAGWEPGKQTMCGQHAWNVTRSDSQFLVLPCRQPAGLSWCPACIGKLAEFYGLLDDIAAEVISYDPGLYSPGEAFVDAQRAERRRRLLGEPS